MPRLKSFVANPVMAAQPMECIVIMVPTAPYLRTSQSVSRIMWSVSASLLPAVIVGLVNWRLAALATLVGSIGFSLLFEALLGWTVVKRNTLGDGSAFLTGLLLALSLPPAMPLWALAGGALVAIGGGKYLFGGLGKNIFNPALLGRVALFATLPSLFALYPLAHHQVDALSAASPLTMLKHGQLSVPSANIGQQLAFYYQLGLGTHSGSVGETSALALLLGAGLLLARGILTWHIPLSFLAAVGIGGWLFGGGEQLFGGDGMVHLLSGGTMLGAFYFATDYVTAPQSRMGRVLYGALCGAMTIAIRLTTALPEGVMYAILLANPFVALFRLPVLTKLRVTQTLLFRFSLATSMRALLAAAVVVAIAVHLLQPPVYQLLQLRQQRHNREQLLSEQLRALYRGKQVQQVGLWTVDKQRLPFYTIVANKRTVGYAIASTAQGYAGPILVLVGLDTLARIDTLHIVSHSETPRLGAKIERDSFKAQFTGKGLDELKVVKGQQGQGISALSAATISTKAVTEQAVARAVGFIMERFARKSMKELRVEC
jgi:electron transport complex protein RnfD